MYKISANYKPVLAVRETEHAIVAIKKFFQTSLSTELNLTRVTAPLFVPSGRGINDDLNGVEEPVSFAVKDMGGQRMEIVQSLAKWKRLKVTEMGCKPGFGIYTDMNAIRPDETLDAIHSLYVDQWDWELCIDEKDRNVFFLLDIVKKVYRSLKRTEFYIFDHYSKLSPILPEEIKLIYSDDLQREYPKLTPKERENAAAKKYGAVFIVGIGGKLPDGSVHDGRAPDYDDWITESGDGHVGLNGDLILWNNVLGTAFELSSMGIRVSPESLRAQLKERGMEERAELDFHKRLLNGELSFTLGGGIGQSRLCMFLLRKAHIGETQVSAWPESIRQECKAAGIPLL